MECAVDSVLHPAATDILFAPPPDATSWCCHRLGNPSATDSGPLVPTTQQLRKLESAVARCVSAGYADEAKSQRIPSMEKPIRFETASSSSDIAEVLFHRAGPRRDKSDRVAALSGVSSVVRAVRTRGLDKSKMQLGGYTQDTLGISPCCRRVEPPLILRALGAPSPIALALRVGRWGLAKAWPR